MKMAVFVLTCADKKEADKIGKTLLKKKLIACTKEFPVSSSFWWKGKIDNVQEVILMMESIEENFEKVNKEIKKLHSYETFVLFSLPVGQTTKGVKKWLNNELK